MPKIRNENQNLRNVKGKKPAKAAGVEGGRNIRLKLKRDIGTDYKNNVNYFKDIPSELDTCMILWLQNRIFTGFYFCHIF